MPTLLSINNYHYRRGGAEVVYLTHNRLFEEAGWDVAPFAMHHPKNEPAATSKHFVDEIEFGNAYNALDKASMAARIIYSCQARDRMKGLLAEKRPTIAHAHNVYHHISPSIFPLLRQSGIPLVMTVHDLKLACPAYTMRVNGAVCERCKGGRIHNVVVNRCIKDSRALSSLILFETAVHRALGLYKSNVDRFVVPSRFLIDKLVEWGWPRDRFVHVPNCADVEPEASETTPGRRFVYFGRLSHEKGLDTFIQAAGLSRLPITLVGTGPQETHLRALAEQSGADVNFAGYQTGAALHALIRSARAVVLPSTWYENAPLTILESYGLGRPLIGSRIGGIPEHVREGETGLTVAPGDADALSDAMVRLAQMPDARVAEMGAAARAWVADEFSPARYRERMRAVYRETSGVAA